MDGTPIALNLLASAINRTIAAVNHVVGLQPSASMATGAQLAQASRDVANALAALNEPEPPPEEQQAQNAEQEAQNHPARIADA